MNLNTKMLDWINTLPVWQQRALSLVIEKNNNLNENHYDEIINLLENEDKFSSNKEKILFENFSSAENISVIKLKSISNIKGIDALSPKNSLNFNSGNISVIYGGTGSGKSGYTRILKKVSSNPSIILKVSVLSFG